MAVMHPPELPIAVLADPARRVEADVFRLLAKRLDDSFHVFFRCGVEGQNPELVKVPDFIILHNRYGLLGLAIDGNGAPHAGGEPRALPHSPIRSAVRSLIFGLKEQGIRFYIPAPCCVIFPAGARAHYQQGGGDLDYTPLFPEDYDDLQNKIIGMMPISAGYQSTWRVPNAVEKIMPLLRVNMPVNGKPKAVVVNAPEQMEGQFLQTFSKDGETAPRIIYVVRAIDIVLAFATIIALIMLISFLPDQIIEKGHALARSWQGK